MLTIITNTAKALGKQARSLFEPEPTIKVVKSNNPYLHGSIALKYSHDVEFFNKLETLITGQSLPVRVSMPMMKVPDVGSAFWWFLSHADNWELVESGIAAVAAGERSFANPLANKAVGVKSEYLEKWLDHMKDPEFKNETLGGYNIAVSSNGFEMDILFIPVGK